MLYLLNAKLPARRRAATLHRNKLAANKSYFTVRASGTEESGVHLQKRHHFALHDRKQGVLKSEAR